MAKNKQYFDSVTPHVNFPDLEERILKFWKKEKIFEKSVEDRPLNKKWTFLDGPPFVTGMPHYGSLLSSLPKDLFGRFWTMKGYRVRRVWGWDGHGLPIENKVENKLGVKRKKDIEEKIGVGVFIEECKKYVSQVSGEWEWYVDHIGRWVDFKNAYKTWDLDYMESVMWVFKNLYDKSFIYKGLRVSLYCPHCSTPISNFEVAMDADNYKEITEPSNTYKYKLKGEDKTYLLAWSTTPWNKIATPALAVNPANTYVKVKQNDEFYILAKDTLKMLNDEKYEIHDEFKGEKLVGNEFEPHYDFYGIEPGKRAFVIIPGDFVTSEEGTGVVTIAAYGEDDLKAMNSENIQVVLHVDEEGNLKDTVPNWGGMYYLDVNPLVNEDLKKRGLMYREENYTHPVPTCWRCHTRLYYAPQNAWFVNIQKLKSKLKKTNEKVNWFPEHFKYGRFLKSMEGAPDWCISRSRYWGSPVPVWETPSGKRIVPGSIRELEELSGQKISDLHKPDIDNITIKDPETGEVAKRVPEVLDSWIEAGSASFAERHYPFSSKEKLEEFFPPDFISEYTGQIRAWFYVLHVITTALFESNAFKNVLVTGVILGTDGRKMSKNYGNYPDPKQMLQTYGGDALRLYLMGSPVMKGEDIRISEEDYRNQVRGFMLILWNVYNFFVTYANVDNWKPDNTEPKPTDVLDKWILSRMYGNIKNITEEGYEKFNTTEITGNAWIFLQDLSRWYIRRIRDRVGPATEDGKDKNDAYNTLYFVLTEYVKVLAPLIPFVSEEIYKNLTKEKSVHLALWPDINEKLRNPKLDGEMEKLRKIAEKAHAERKVKQIPVRQPLNSLATSAHLSPELQSVLKDEINIKSIVEGKTLAKLDTAITPALKEEADTRELIRKIQEKRKEMGMSLTQSINVSNPWLPESKELTQKLKKSTFTVKLEKGNFEVKTAI